MWCVCDAALLLGESVMRMTDDEVRLINLVEILAEENEEVTPPSDEQLMCMSEHEVRTWFKRGGSEEKKTNDEKSKEEEEEVAVVVMQKETDKKRGEEKRRVIVPSGAVVEAEDIRKRGLENERSGRYVEAFTLYSRAIATSLGQDPRPFESRSALLLTHQAQLEHMRTKLPALAAREGRRMPTTSTAIPEVAHADACEACRLRPRRSQSLVLKGNALMAMGEYEKALSVFQDVRNRAKNGGFIVDAQTLDAAKDGEERASKMVVEKKNGHDERVRGRTETRAHAAAPSGRTTSSAAASMRQGNSMRHQRWMAEKELGNTAFRETRFNDAVRHYDRALKLALSELEHDNTETRNEVLASLYSNRSASACLIAVSLSPASSAVTGGDSGARAASVERATQDAIRCTEHRPMWHKGWSRLGAAHSLAGKLDEAAKAFSEGLRLDAGNEACAEGLRDVSSRRKAAETKAKADTAFKSGDFHDAVDFYTLALRALGGAGEGGNDAAILLSNRSACHAKLKRFDLAIRDARQASSMRPNWARPYARLGTALCSDNKPEQAYEELAIGLARCSGRIGGASNGALDDLVKMRLSAFGALTGTATRLGISREHRLLGKDRDFPQARTRVFASSDLHVDQHGNISWVNNIDATKFRDDVLIVAGDVGDTFQAVKAALSALVRKFRRVFFVPGNHEMWVRPDTQDKRFADSVCKLIALQKLCDDLGVDIGPAEVCRGVFVVPLYSWYTHLFDTHDPKPGRLRFDKFCKWPAGVPDSAVHEYFLNMNKSRVYGIDYAQSSKDRAGSGDAPTVISFSHFLPRPELPCPPVHELVKNVGDAGLDEQVQRIGADVHVYGHTHINGDGPCQYRREKGDRHSSRKDPCRYVQSALEGGARDLYCVYNKGHLSGIDVKPW